MARRIRNFCEDDVEETLERLLEAFSEGDRRMTMRTIDIKKICARAHHYHRILFLLFISSS